MRPIRFDEPGPPSVLQCVDVPIPEPKPGEVLIRAHAIGVGIPDTLIRAGTYGFMPPLPATPGTELSGTIEKVGPGVTSRQPGQRVYTTARERDRTAAVITPNTSRHQPRRRFFCLIVSISMPQLRSPIIRSPITSSTTR
jgi:NADPH:quinone reductase-like Zn-dependent oxidoreductase